MTKAPSDDAATAGGTPKPEPAAEPLAAGETPKPEPAAPPPSSEVKLRLFGRTDVGQVREHNEDNFIVADLTKESRGPDGVGPQPARGRACSGVCDGMGGAAAGEVASQLAVDIIYQRMAIGDPPKDHDELAARLVHAIEAAGLRIFSEAKLDRTRRGMGTTATIASLVDDHLFLGQVGDSRGYILRGDRLVQVTRDQSLVNQLIEAGSSPRRRPRPSSTTTSSSRRWAPPTRSRSTSPTCTSAAATRSCSAPTGLSGMVRNDEIREVLRSVEDPLEACKTLTDRANQAGGHDNITVVVAKFDGASLVDATRDDVDGLRYQKYQLPEPPPSSAQTLPEPPRKLKDLREAKPSSRPPARGPDLEVSEAGGDGLYGDGEEGGEGSPLYRNSDDPIHIPTEGAPQWLVIMMIASAVASVTIAGYYLLR